MPTTNTTRPVGRPRAVVKLPRRKQFTVSDVIQINELSPLTVRSYLNRLVSRHELLKEPLRTKLAQRGRPRFIYSIARAAR
jgi:predicted ArsR family transcriptional regulator